MKALSKILILIALVFSTQLAFSQEDTTKVNPKVTVIKNDGATYTGTIEKDDAREILLRSDQVGLMYIPKHLIKEIKPFKEEAEEEVVKETTVVDTVKEEVVEIEKEEPIEVDPKTKKEVHPDDTITYANYHSTKNIYSDNAFPLRKGEAYLKTTFVGIEGGLPLTKNWSVSAIASFFGAPAALKTKFSFPVSDEFRMSLDAGYGTMAFGTWLGRGIRDGAGFMSFTATFGDRINNFSVKGGYVFIHEYWNNGFTWDPNTQMFIPIQADMAYHHGPFINVGGQYAFTNSSSLVCDATAVLIENSFGMSVGASVRFGKSPKNKWLLGGSLYVVDGFFSPIPMPHVSYTYIFPARKP
ncbi:hypothetical protein K6119_11665 [Paracrocinitomix mangrovi]|uniref:hypothetical protein n=1 Tax=Paracrocinitomix mangrovi TaxID=2862509 RepID=UPI001C8E290D|nr:hypothetical protein [Paracrocinitomix mangrovi]UKN00392.1 hypothetical protein K6119_11665 [Paracrocinitomix mangrovi]